jgi:UrcA family protein
MRPKTIAPLIAVTLALGATTAASAAPAERISQSVRVADLNLQSTAGAQVALQRLRQAARTICGGETGSRDLKRQILFEACVRDAVNTTVASAHIPMLATLNGAPLDTVVASAD